MKTILLSLALLFITCYCAQYQEGVTSGNPDNGAFLILNFTSNVFNDAAAKKYAQRKIGQINEFVDRIKINTTNVELVATIAIGMQVAGQWFPRYANFPRYKEKKGVFANFPATGGDVLVHIKSTRRDLCWALARLIELEFAAVTQSFDDVYTWVYLRDPKTNMGRDISGFVDGTENPQETRDKINWAVIPQSTGEPGGGSFVLTQKWVHNKLNSFEKMPLLQQEYTIGRTKLDSKEIIERPEQSHISRVQVTDAQGEEQKIVRQSQSFGDVHAAGLLFVAYSKSLETFEMQLGRMVDSNLTDFIMLRLSTPVTGQYWYAPSVEELKAFVYQ